MDAKDDRRMHWAAFADDRVPRLCWASAVGWALHGGEDSLKDCTVSHLCFVEGSGKYMHLAKDCYCGKHTLQGARDQGLVGDDPSDAFAEAEREAQDDSIIEVWL